MTSNQVIVIGAGIIGIHCAWALRAQGYDVQLIDQHLPATGTSYGNAGAFAISDIIPIADVGNIKKLPLWLTDSLGPLTIRWRHAPKLLPWFLRFLKETHPKRVAHNTEALAQLLLRTTTDYQTVITASGLDSLWQRAGNLTLYRHRHELEADSQRWEQRRQYGITCQELDRQGLISLEPLLEPEWCYGVFVPEWSTVDDPYLFSMALYDDAIKKGVRFQQSKVNRVYVEDHKVIVGLEHGHAITADHVVIAAGMASAPLALSMGHYVPLESERGYHVTLPHANKPLKRFIQCASDSFVILPMPNGGLRLAGTVEFSDQHALPDWRRSTLLIKKAQDIIGPFSTEGMTLWQGNRPSLPDTIPVISRDPQHPEVLYAFGHGHLGLTMGATTGHLVAQLVANQHTDIDMSAYRINRYSRWWP